MAEITGPPKRNAGSKKFSLASQKSATAIAQTDIRRAVQAIPSARLVTIAGRDHMSAVVAREFKQAALEFLTADS